jgi:hypothetical protein
MSDETVTRLPVADDATVIAAAMSMIRKRQTAMRLARIRREAANDNRAPAA